MTNPGNNYYQILGLHPSASNLEVRRQYRELSKQFHPDTTTLPKAIAKTKFQELNQAYATLSNPDKRSLYDLQIGYSRLNVIQAPPSYNQDNHSVYTGPSDRPLSAGEIFALFLLVSTFVGCLLLALVVAIVRGDSLSIT
ncbi:MAG: J domain-containing protein [Gloeocapsa sp. DLM2.Bin57]|nr:MAG: J domain-containing protein [Gloeocapsa sp. DLM2.Bin57]